jgi:SacI restriction endonuclease
VTITLRPNELGSTLEQAYGLAIGEHHLPSLWIARAEKLSESPSVAYIAAVGSVLLARATDDGIDAFVIQAREGSAGAFNLRAAATALGSKRRSFGYDIGSSSERDPINHGTLVGSTRWDVALDRIRADHKPFFQLILTWLADVNRMNRDEAREALAAYIRVRRGVARGAAADQIPTVLATVPTLTILVQVLDGFVGADPEVGARGMALVAAAYRMAGFEASLPSRNDPRRIDITIKRDGMLVIASEVKQLDTSEGTGNALAQDAADGQMRRALLAVLPPGKLVDFDRSATIRRAEKQHGVVLRVTSGTRELLHEALSAGNVEIDEFCAGLPRAFGEALRDIRAADETVATWAAITGQWQ